jgi:hypothetical protein
MTEPTDALISTAYHEAGHVAAAWILGGDAAIRGEVTIVANEWCRGSATVGSGFEPGEMEEAWYQAINGEPIDPALRLRVESDVIVTLAGLKTAIVASRRHKRFAWPEEGSPVALALELQAAGHRLAAAKAGQSGMDSDYVDLELGWITADVDERAAYRAWLDRRAWQLVDFHPLLWRLVDALVGPLMQRRTLSREEVIAIIAATIHPEPTALPSGSSGYSE